MKTCDRSGRVVGFWQSPIVLFLLVANVVAYITHVIVYYATSSSIAYLVTSYIAAGFGSILCFVYLWRLSLCKVRRIRRLQFPKLLFIVLLVSLKFTFVYASMWQHDPTCFAGIDPASTKWGVFLDMLYFSITNITTLGLGDVAALCSMSRIVVSVEMLYSVVLLIFAVAKAAEYAGCPDGEAESAQKTDGVNARRMTTQDGSMVYVVPADGSDCVLRVP